MAYNKNTWQNGDIITAEKLNNMEDGIATSVLRIDITEEQGNDGTRYVLSKTFAEIKECIDNGGFAITVSDMTPSENEYTTYIEPVTFISASEFLDMIGYTVTAGYGEDAIQYLCYEVDDYPVFNSGK